MKIFDFAQQVILGPVGKNYNNIDEEMKER